jgi:hypothetical protein
METDPLLMDQYGENWPCEKLPLRTRMTPAVINSVLGAHLLSSAARAISKAKKLSSAATPSPSSELVS